MGGDTKYIYIVNVTRQLSIDMINCFNKQGAGIHLITGSQEVNYAPLDKEVKVTRLIKYNNTSAFKRIFTWAIFTIHSFFYVLFAGRKKELIIITSPPFIVFTGWFFKMIRGQKYHLIIWDLYPDVLVNFGVLKETSLITKAWKKMNKKCFDKATSIFTIGIHLSDAIKKYTTCEPQIIQNWANTDFIKPLPRSENPFAKKYQLENKLVVMYSGNMGMTHDIESIVNTAEILKDNSQIQFLIIGEGAKKAKISRIIEEKKLKNILLLPYQEKEMLPFSLTAADIGIVTLSEGAESVSVPSKTYYTLASGAAILALASIESELALLIKKYNCGIIFDKPDHKAIADFILSQVADKASLENFKKNSRQASLDFTPKNAELFYKAIVTENR